MIRAFSETSLKTEPVGVPRDGGTEKGSKYCKDLIARPSTG